MSQQGCILSGVSRGQSIFLLFLASTGYPHSLAHGYISLASASVHIFSFLMLTLLPPSYNDLYDYSGPLDNPG